MSKNPERDAEILRRHGLAEKSTDIAAALGISDDIVNGVIFRATKRNRPSPLRTRAPGRTRLQAQIDRIVEETQNQAGRIEAACASIEAAAAANAELAQSVRSLAELVNAQTGFLVDLAKDFHDLLGALYPEAKPGEERPRKYEPRKFRVKRFIDMTPDARVDVTAFLLGDPPPDRAAPPASEPRSYRKPVTLARIGEHLRVPENANG